MQFIAVQGPIPLQAYSGVLDALAQDGLTVTSINGEIEIKAPNRKLPCQGDST